MNGQKIYNSVDFAKYMVIKANERAIDMNMTKTQKLLYIAYGAQLALADERLFEEHPQAWPYGPVFPTVRNKLLKSDFAKMSIDNDKLQEFRDDAHCNSLIEFVFKGFKLWTASQLTIWSHQEGSPWELTTRNIGFKWGDEIPDTYIKEYFCKLIK